MLLYYAKFLTSVVFVLLPLNYCFSFDNSYQLLARASSQNKKKKTKEQKPAEEQYLRDTVPPYIAGHKDYAAFRIPTLLTDENWIYTFAQGRKDSYEDFSGAQHIVFRRSKTRGRKWKKMQVLAEGKEGYMCGPMSPVLIDKSTILLMYVEQHELDNRSDVFTIKTIDAGKNWSKPKNVTDKVRRPYDVNLSGKWFGIGPSSGIVKKYNPNKGRIILVASQSGVKIDGKHQKFAPSHLVFSDDGGDNWEIGATMNIKSKEATVVELANGDLMVNARNNDLVHRIVALSKDGGENFFIQGGEPDNEGKLLSDCGNSFSKENKDYKCGVHSGLLVHSQGSSPDKSVLIFSNPQGEQIERTIGTLQRSDNSGKTWRRNKIRYTDDIMEDDQGYSGYSNITLLDDGESIGILFERGGTSPKDYEKGLALIENESWQINFDTFNNEYNKKLDRSLKSRHKTAKPRHHMIDFKIIPFAAFKKKKLRQSIEEPKKGLKACVNMDSSMGDLRQNECQFK